ncbi:hypothetical protein L873DRAFT_1810833 [Choiromyces venosus 120613-1]|uniref:Uncharacterized protein n=1 Tax=Choiromyces venosus 120613-1 TaxID=1336337 RepID=A0A3N4JEX0_9PEZI|nr:hypothetical protein L873DRAFT_1810833 [Choiromyces venosus 120613-1]
MAPKTQVTPPSPHPLPTLSPHPPALSPHFPKHLPPHKIPPASPLKYEKKPNKQPNLAYLCTFSHKTKVLIGPFPFHYSPEKNPR